MNNYPSAIRIEPLTDGEKEKMRYLYHVEAIGAPLLDKLFLIRDIDQTLAILKTKNEPV